MRPEAGGVRHVDMRHVAGGRIQARRGRGSTCSIDRMKLCNLCIPRRAVRPRTTLPAPTCCCCCCTAASRLFHSSYSSSLHRVGAWSRSDIKINNLLHSKELY